MGSADEVGNKKWGIGNLTGLYGVIVTQCVHIDSAYAIYHPSLLIVFIKYFHRADCPGYRPLEGTRRA